MSGPGPGLTLRILLCRLPVLLSFFSGVVAVANDTIEEIHVTATRRSVSASEVPAALTVVTADEVRTQKLVTDALSAETGVYLQQTTPGQGAVIIRGLKGSAVLHLVDGVRLNNAIFRSAPTPYFALVPPGAVERIEVVRGSPASLYGSDAVGGVVQIVTRLPKFESPELAVRGSAFLAFDTAELGQTYRGTLDIGTERFSSSFSGGFLKTGDRQIGGGDRIGPSGYTAQSARLVFSATPDEDRSWLLDLHYLEQPETPRVDELVPGFGQTQPSSSEFSFKPNRRMFARAGYAHNNGWLALDWAFDLAWQQIVDDRVNRNYRASERRREANRSDLFAAMFSGARQTARGSWIVGAETYYDLVRSARTEEDISSGLLQSLASRFPDRSTVRQAAVFANVSHRVSDRHLLNAGARFTRVVVDLPGTIISPETSVQSNDLSGDLGWIFELPDAWQLIANIGWGIRAPNVFDLGTLGERPGNRFNIPNAELTAERVTNIDTGVRRQSDRLQFELVLYWLDYGNKISSVLTGEVTADGRDVVQSVNAANVKIRGAETGTTVRITDSLSAHAVLNYTWGEQNIFAGIAEPADRIPPLSGLVNLRYESEQRFAIDAWLQFAARQDRLSARDVRDIRINPTGTSGWGVLGGRALWENGAGWRFSFAVNNILDRQYRWHGSGIDAAGRNVSISVRRDWD
jgi:outer membrane receptor protein involved in Fe transport